MKTKKIIQILAIGLSAGLYSCERDVVHIQNTGSFKDTSGPLKASADFPIGIGINYTSFMTDDSYKQVVTTEATNVTFGYEMKHGALVKNDGTLDFTNADALYNAATTAGLQVYGHTLAWYQNQNASYLKSYAGVTVQAPTNLLANPGFELGSGSTFTNWTAFNGGSAFVSGSGSSEVRTGSRSLKVVNPSDNPGAQYKVQLASDQINTTIGTQYTISLWIKATAAGGSMRLSTQPTAQYEGDQAIGTTFSQISWTITAKDTKTTFLIDIGLKANTYLIDDMSVTEVVAASSPGDIAAKVDVALNDFITKTVTHYKGKVKAWDVVNELFTDNGAIRTNANSISGTPASDVFVWSEYLGKNLGVKAFTYAKAADPDALLFINDYNLESTSATQVLSPKVDSVIAYVNYLKGKGVQVDGIGTQMHISTTTSYAAIDAVFQKLAATGLLVRVSELDVQCNANPAKTNFSSASDKFALQAQAVMYNYVVKSYLNNVPAAQRHGITIWGVSDKDSWILINQKKLDAPLLFDSTYNKKPSYAGFLQALKNEKI